MSPLAPRSNGRPPGGRSQGTHATRGTARRNSASGVVWRAEGQGTRVRFDSGTPTQYGMQVAPRRVERPRAVRIRSLRTQQRAKSQCQQTPSAPGPPGAARIPLVNDRRSDVCSLPDATPLAGSGSNSGPASPGGPCFMCHLCGFARVVIDIYGEFDPGSGRTLAACLTHASRARPSLRGGVLAANG